MSEQPTAAATASFDYAMPSLGADMDEGSVVEWLVEVGDRVERGQIVARVETEKSDIDIEIWQPGVVDEIIVPTRRVVPVGTPLMRLRSVDQESSATRPQPRRAPVGSREHVPATPLARRLAAERDIALGEIVGSGPGGAVRARDLATQDVAPAGTEPPPPAVSAAEG